MGSLMAKLTCFALLVAQAWAAFAEPDYLCGNDEDFLATDRIIGERLGRVAKETSSMSRDSTQTWTPPAAPPIYSNGTAYLDDLLAKSALMDREYLETREYAETRTEEAYIKIGYTDEDSSDADQDGWIDLYSGWYDFEFRVYSVNIWFEDEADFEVLVSTELSEEAGLELMSRALKFLDEIPLGALEDLEKVVIHALEPYQDEGQGIGRATGGLYNNTMTLYPNTINSSDPWLMGVLLHEIVHISLDEHIRESDGWVSAQNADEGFISLYAETNPNTEDLSETWPMWFRMRYFGDYFSTSEVAALEQQLKHRLAFLDEVIYYGGDTFGYFFPASYRVWGDYDPRESRVNASLEEPVNGGVHSGITNVRGWAISDTKISRVALYIDGEYAADIPYGGDRPDVGGAFPDYRNPRYSGFGTTYNYSELTAGSHTMQIKVYTIDGKIIESSSEFTVERLNEEFFGSDKPVSLDGAFVSARDDEVDLQGVLIDGETYDMTLKWAVPAQGFQVIRVD